MNKRDFFAAMALLGELISQVHNETWTDFSILSKRCFNVADKMIEESEKRE